MVTTRRILFVCLGNICRSPLAEAVLKDLAGPDSGLEIDSAGTSGWHDGEAADPRTIAVGRRHGVPVTSRSRAVATEDFEHFDLVVAMDTDNRDTLLSVSPPRHRHKIRRLRDWDPEGPGDVPDPYYGGPDGFEDNFRMVSRCCRALLDEIAT